MREDPGDRAGDDALDELVDLGRHLGLGQLDLLANEQLCLLGDVLDGAAEVRSAFRHLRSHHLEDPAEQEAPTNAAASSSSGFSAVKGPKTIGWPCWGDGNVRPGRGDRRAAARLLRAAAGVFGLAPGALLFLAGLGFGTLGGFLGFARLLGLLAGLRGLLLGAADARLRRAIARLGGDGLALDAPHRPVRGGGVLARGRGRAHGVRVDADRGGLAPRAIVRSQREDPRRRA
jgi:hypothetical protein